ncbi:STAS domain-containing protein [Phragmitibacter flavus]|uniref:Anti-sigma factor antagonist n=1 Tax=Phragmitibacter flavus TaxID=2576071 RepID=A0A5R8KGK9_9BACT|nr:STAS domain-containing protein [Phragmitibacter flavus]TLD71443.1 STAS domain-containing protein [Phragmitibacter flavus]
MQLPIHQEGNITVASLTGQIDSVSAVDLERDIMLLLDQNTKSLLLDCSELDYINSAGLRVFLLAAKRLEQSAGSLAFCSLDSNVLMVFETIGFDRILTIYPDKSAALAGMNSATAKAA